MRSLHPIRSLLKKKLGRLKLMRLRRQKISFLPIRPVLDLGLDSFPAMILIRPLACSCSASASFLATTKTLLEEVQQADERVLADKRARPTLPAHWRLIGLELGAGMLPAALAQSPLLRLKHAGPAVVPGPKGSTRT